jgi:hypothetical protein
MKDMVGSSLLADTAAATLVEDAHAAAATTMAFAVLDLW